MSRGDDIAGRLWAAYGRVVSGRSQFGDVDMREDVLASERQRLYANLVFLAYARRVGYRPFLVAAARALFRLHLVDLGAETPEGGVVRTPAEREIAMTVVIDCLRRGMSVAAACAAVPVNRETVYSWARTWPEFSLAFETARRYARATGARDDRRGERERSVGVEFYGEVREPALPVGRKAIR